MQPTSASPETGKLLSQGMESSAVLIVTQPPKVEMLLDALAAIDKISERISEDRSADMGSGARGKATGKGDDGTTATSIRDQKIANLPAQEVMCIELQKQIEQEVTELHREMKRAKKRLTRPGAAYKLNALYTRMRRLNALIAELFDAAYDVVKRLFIKVVIDRQKVL
ncbi:MAG: hypothetical protein Greene041662_765 [Candidatus Peregrinibacteria bacterium Greene0416_62]|nr:MAG: hypothetical protein Greene041662_765 [Candidatus Peregrinibacteria bacterium Greene0416_62]TSD00077.1 MAG: hypothetical protein Greene101449_363 [Candidatus Peregrinibacteria bacterium Greene1014_49]